MGRYRPITDSPVQCSGPGPLPLPSACLSVPPPAAARQLASDHLPKLRSLSTHPQPSSAMACSRSNSMCGMAASIPADILLPRAWRNLALLALAAYLAYTLERRRRENEVRSHNCHLHPFYTRMICTALSALLTIGISPPPFSADAMAASHRQSSQNDGPSASTGSSRYGTPTPTDASCPPPPPRRSRGVRALHHHPAVPAHWAPRVPHPPPRERRSSPVDKFQGYVVIIIGSRSAL